MLPTPTLIPLAQIEMGPLFMWLGILIGLAMVMAVIGLALRRRLLSAENPVEGQRRLLDDLRAMRDRGELTPEEYDAARKSMAAAIAGRRDPNTTMRPAPRPISGSGELVAPPGYDLTGRPLPKPPGGSGERSG